MDYKGRQINEDLKLVREREPNIMSCSYAKYEYSIDELEEMIEAIKSSKLIDPEISIDVDEGYEGDYGSRDPSTSVYVIGFRQETEDERDIRVLKEMQWIDKAVKEKEEAEKREKANKEFNIQVMIDKLKKEGYKISKK